jgi:hypothetical protein
VWYRDEILDVYVRHCAGPVGPEFILMDDNTVLIALAVPSIGKIVCIDWPTHSPDLDPFEYVWNMLQVALSCPRAQPTTFAELGNALVEEWNNLTIETPGCSLTSCLGVVKPSLMQEEVIPGLDTSSTN